MLVRFIDIDWSFALLALGSRVDFDRSGSLPFLLLSLVIISAIYYQVKRELL